jgi:hypothetical protein
VIGPRHTIRSVGEELLRGLSTGQVQPTPVSQSTAESTTSRVAEVGTSGRLIGFGASALLILGVAVGWALTGGMAGSIAGLDGPLLAVLTPVPNRDKGPEDGAPEDVRVRGGATFEVPKACSLVLDSPRPGFAQIVWVDPGFEIPVQVLPASPIGVEAGQPRQFDDVPDVNGPIVALVVVTPKPAGDDIKRVAKEIVSGLGQGIRVLAPRDLAGRIKQALQTDAKLRRFPWTAIGSIQLEPPPPAAPAASDQGDK